MNTEKSRQVFRIISSSWETASQDNRNELSNILGCDLECTKSFCNVFLEQYLLIHEIGHVIQQLFDRADNIDDIQKEYEANLFAIKYFEYQKDRTLLNELSEWITRLVAKYEIDTVYRPENINDLLPRLRLDRLKHGLIQFIIIKKAMEDNDSFETVVSRLTNRKTTKLTMSTRLSEKLYGKDLLDECLNIVFENELDRPTIEIEYHPRLGFQSFIEIF